MAVMRTTPLLLAAVAVSACAGDEPTQQDDGAQDSRLRFAQCMRENGVPSFPEPDEKGRFAITPETQRNVSRAALDRARERCNRHLRDAGPPPELSEEEQVEEQDRLVAFSRCMRRQGFDLPDPRVSAGEANISLPEGLNTETPRFRDAQAACEEHLR